MCMRVSVGRRVYECVFVSECICRQMRNPFQCLAARALLPGANFPDAPQSGANSRLSPPAGLGHLSRIPFPHRNHRDAQNRSRKLPQIWSPLWEAGCPAVLLAVGLLPPLQPLPLTLFHSCFTSLCCPQAVWPPVLL